MIFKKEFLSKKKNTHLYAGFLIKKIIVFKNNALNNLTFSKNQKTILLTYEEINEGINFSSCNFLPD